MINSRLWLVKTRHWRKEVGWRFEKLRATVKLKGIKLRADHPAFNKSKWLDFLYMDALEVKVN